MSYYEDGLGQFSLMSGGAPLLSGGLSVKQPSSTQAAATTGGPGVMPAELVQAMADPMVSGGFAASDAAGQKIRMTGVWLAALVRAAKGAPVSAQSVLSLLIGILSTTPGGNGWINQAFAHSDYAPLRTMTIESIVSDIGAGKYRPPAPTMQISPFARVGLTAKVGTAATAALKSQVAATAVATAQTKQAVADQAQQKAAATQAPVDQAVAQQAQQAADQAAVTAQAATADAATAATQVAVDAGAQALPNQSEAIVGPSDLVAPATDTTGTATTAASAGGAGGIPWLYVGIGAAGLAVVGYLVMGRGSSTPNRKRSKKNRHHRRARRAARKA